jgi:glycosyltransferase involved in cell wall biosynthesis
MIYSPSAQVVWKKEILVDEEKIGKISVKRFDAQKSDFFVFKYILPLANFLLPLDKVAQFNHFLQRFSDKFFYENLGPNSKSMEEAFKKDFKNYDLVILSYFPFKTIYTFSYILRNSKTKFCIIPLLHENDNFHQKKFLEKCLRMPNFILELNEYSKNLLAEKFNKPVYNLKGFTEKPKKLSKKAIENFKNKYRLNDKFVILIVGRKELNKNYKAVIDSLKYINDADTVILFIGEDIDKKPLSRKRIIYLKNVDDKTLSLAYNASNVLVNMSLAESLGLVFLEAWSYRLPVIGNINCNPVKCLIKSGEDGFLCYDPRDLAEKIMALKQNPLIAKKMGLTGQNRAKNEFSREAYKKTVESIIADALF